MGRPVFPQGGRRAVSSDGAVRVLFLHGLRGRGVSGGFPARWKAHRIPARHPGDLAEAVPVLFGRGQRRRHPDVSPGGQRRLGLGRLGHRRAGQPATPREDQGLSAGGGTIRDPSAALPVHGAGVQLLLPALHPHLLGDQAVDKGGDRRRIPRPEALFAPPGGAGALRGFFLGSRRAGMLSPLSG